MNGPVFSLNSMKQPNMEVLNLKYKIIADLY